MSDVIVDAVHLDMDLVVCSVGGVAFTLPIISCYDLDGDETDDKEMAVSCYAGHEGIWITISIGGLCKSRCFQ